MAEAKRKNTKIAQARQIFEKQLPKLEKQTSREFRSNVIGEIMDKTKAGINSAAAMYNTCKKEAEEAGQLAAGTVGRSPSAEEITEPWVVVDKETNKVVAQASSRRKAQEASKANEADTKVVKTEDYQGTNETQNGSGEEE